MGKPRSIWWSYAKGMIRQYPQLKEEYAELHEQSMVANYSGMPKGSSGEGHRGVERIAVRELSQARQKEYEAVCDAIAVTERYSNGSDRLQVIDMVLWKRSHTLEGAAMAVSCSVATAKRWHSGFVWLVAQNYGLLDN